MFDCKTQPDKLDRYLHETSMLLDLPIAPDYVVGVKKYLQISLRMAAALEAVPLQMEDDFAPIFHAQ